MKCHVHIYVFKYVYHSVDPLSQLCFMILLKIATLHKVKIVVPISMAATSL